MVTKLWLVFRLESDNYYSSLPVSTADYARAFSIINRKITGSKTDWKTNALISGLDTLGRTHFEHLSSKVDRHSHYIITDSINS